MKKIILATSFIYGVFVSSTFAQELKTQEQSLHETFAKLYGSTLRVNQINREECGIKYQGTEKIACEQGYDNQDKILNKPISN